MEINTFTTDTFNISPIDLIPEDSLNNWKEDETSTQQESDLETSQSAYELAERHIQNIISMLSNISPSLYGSFVQSLLTFFSELSYTSLPNHQTEQYLTLEAAKIIEEIESMDIAICDYVPIHDYLTEHHDIALLLSDVCKIAGKHIDKETQLAIDVYSDPDGGEGHLSLYIRPKKYSPDIFNIIDRIEQEYIDQLVGKSGWIIVTTDFRDQE